jgi:hypothetical protein
MIKKNIGFSSSFTYTYLVIVLTLGVSNAFVNTTQDDALGYPRHLTGTAITTHTECKT